MEMVDQLVDHVFRWVHEVVPDTVVAYIFLSRPEGVNGSVVSNCGASTVRSLWSVR